MLWRSSVLSLITAAYSLVDKLVLGVGLETVLDATRTYNLLVDVEVPAFEYLRLYASYQKIGYSDLSKSFARGQGSGFTFAPDVILLSQARVMILPILFVSAGLRQTYQWDALYKGGTYRAKLDYLLQAELGWEFSG